MGFQRAIFKPSSLMTLHEWLDSGSVVKGFAAPAEHGSSQLLFRSDRSGTPIPWPLHALQTHGEHTNTLANTHAHKIKKIRELEKWLSG